MVITGRISLTSPSIQPPYKIPAKRHSDQSRSAAKKEKRRGAISAAPLTIAGLPFLGPTRLADGLELEVFYATPIGLTIRPGVRWRNVGSPALRAHFALLQLRQTTVSTRRIILLKNVGCNQDCLLATNEIGSDILARHFKITHVCGRQQHFGFGPGDTRQSLSLRFSLSPLHYVIHWFVSRTARHLPSTFSSTTVAPE